MAFAHGPGPEKELYSQYARSIFVNSLGGWLPADWFDAMSCRQRRAGTTGWEQTEIRFRNDTSAEFRPIQGRSLTGPQRATASRGVDWSPRAPRKKTLKSKCTIIQPDMPDPAGETNATRPVKPAL